MKHFAIIGLVALLPNLAAAQETHTGMNHEAMMNGTGMVQGETMATGLQMNPATEAGQSAFAAVEEIVLALDADPDTDWSKVNIPALREHLVDMELVFTDAEVQTTEVENGFQFAVTGAGKTIGSIQRMAIAHAGVMNGTGDWTFSPEKTETGVVLTVTSTADDMDKLRALGFFGIMAMGMHHQNHHWMMATGVNPHG
ncbi:hypothetical protein [Profundibacter amoris]|uniref:Uncharacterized protein n=1 Tax=Profundibacter amoris TaxID=2171755 RepID=A0A347UKA4_9RHOB|nr:hypothetical protein [Profundibacter amoris]AXX99282.1 hypothetical protein BAR1_15885 [Profundibacter amoris]